MVKSKTAIPLAQIKAMAPKYTNTYASYRALKTYTHIKKSFSSKNALSEAVKVIKCVKSLPLSIHLLNILHDKMGNR